VEGERRLGTIEISTRLIKEWKELSPLFSKFIPVHIDQQYHRDVIVYTGYSEMFSINQPGTIPPNYMITFHRQDDGIITVTAER